MNIKFCTLRLSHLQIYSPIRSNATLSDSALHHVWWRASLSFPFVQEAERACLWENVITLQTERHFLGKTWQNFPDLWWQTFSLFSSSPHLWNIECLLITDSANWMPICAALIHRSLERLEGKLRAETCKPIQWGCWVWNKSGENSNRLTIICHSYSYFHSKCV